MNRRKFIKTSMCLGCGTAMLPASQSALLSEISSRFSKDKFIYKRKEDLPKKVRIDACSLCQLNCPVCWVRDSEKKYTKQNFFGYLKFSDFKNFVDDNPQLKAIELSYSGEMFLNPELDKIILYSHSKGIELTALAGVNLNNLSEEMAECLVSNKFKKIVVSIDGATPETYKIYRVGGDYNKVIENIKKINHYKKIYNSEYPELVWKFIVFGHNEHEIELVKKEAKNLNMEIQFAKNYADYYSPVINKGRVLELTGLNLEHDMWCDILKKYDWYYCYMLFEDPQISWNGDLVGCCSAFQDKSYNMNVFKTGFMRALNSTMYVESKRMVTDLTYKPKEDNPCSNCCNYNNVLKKENLYIKKYA